LASTPGHDDLRTSRQLLVVVRLLLDADWQLQHGELVDVDETSRGRFAGWEDLTPAVRRFVTQERETSAARAAN
jgi:hypothetical protein